jgi:hypothetical protein
VGEREEIAPVSSLLSLSPIGGEGRVRGQGR